MRWIRKAGIKFLVRQKGFTLLESLIAVAILAVIGVALANALDTNSRSILIADDQKTAVNLITNYFETIKDCNYSEEYLINQPPLNSIIIPAGYAVDIRTAFSIDGGETWGDFTSDALQRITISISHEGDGRPVLSICTFRNDF
ncbi:prepilin-type N-terminal cleavage/methylation domain-containing protein [Chloroflexota bacterium]